ncbi:MAG: hypothetical protein RSE94_22140, partial [Pseudomonas sp.]
QQKWQQALEQWHDKRSWREDVRFDDVLQYLRQTTVEAQQLQAHCQRSEADLLTWLNQLRPGGESVYHDTIDEQQASQLLETAHAVYTLLGNGEQGHSGCASRPSARAPCLAWRCSTSTRNWPA